MKTVWVLGDQLNRELGALARHEPGEARVLMIESRAAIGRHPFHRQRLHLVLASMRRFADELREAGYEVDYRCSDTFATGFAAHVSQLRPDEVLAMEPSSRSMERRLDALDVTLVKSNQFLCHRDDFKAWAGESKQLRLETFYRWQRKRLGYLMDGDEPSTGRWNYDEENREPPPADGGDWATPQQSRHDALDERVLKDLPSAAPGAGPAGWWATSRRAALARLRHFIEEVLPGFGAHEDAMLANNWHLAHSLLSPYLNLGLISPKEVCDEAEAAFRSGRAPINSVEGLIRQIIGWREFVWGVYWLWPDQYDANALNHRRRLPPAFAGDAETQMRCLQITLDGVRERGWVHHIQRLMVLANFANLYGIHPALVRDWMRASFVDGAEWVMGPNVMGMGLWADGGKMSTKPYVSGGAYIRRMSDYCKDCRFKPSERTGDDACPFTTLYWDFLDRHRERLKSNPRIARQYSTLDRLKDLDEVKSRARYVIRAIRDGRL